MFQHCKIAVCIRYSNIHIQPIRLEQPWSRIRNVAHFILPTSLLYISYYLCLIYSRAMLFTVLMDRYSACFPCTEMEICILNWVDWPLGFDFSINLTNSLDSDLSFESDWDNNHWCLNFWWNWVNSQLFSHTTTINFHQGTILSEFYRQWSFSQPD